MREAVASSEEALQRLTSDRHFQAVIQADGSRGSNALGVEAQEGHASLHDARAWFAKGVEDWCSRQGQETKDVSQSGSREERESSTVNHVT